MRAALAALHDVAACDTIVLSSFEEDALAVAAAARPEISRALLVKTIPSDWQERIERLGCTALHVGERGLARAMIAEVAEICPVRAYTVNAPGRARELFRWGIAAVFTDCPDVILSEIGRGPRVASRWGSKVT
jgi:glycerophosphoryl diester phosphodiesterase